MKNTLILIFAFLTAAAFAPAADFSDKYFDAKETFTAKTKIDAGATVSFTAQRVTPGGKNTAVQSYYYPYLSYKPFTAPAFGSGEFYFSYEYVHYWGNDAAAIRQRAGMVTDINYYPGNWRSFDNFKYSHTLPGRMDWLTVTAGQYSLYFIDGTDYANDMQRGFINTSLSQAGSAAYFSEPGIMLKADIGRGVSIMGGYADAQRTFGRDIDFSTMFGGKYLTFAALQYQNDGGNYNFIAYHIDAAEDGLQTTTGWSFSALRALSDKYSVVARANGTNGEVSWTGIRRSYALGFVYKEPFERSPKDVILLGGAFNQLAEGAPHASETILELAWVFGITKMFTVTPDLQLYPDNGVGDNRRWKTVLGLRTTFFF